MTRKQKSMIGNARRNESMKSLGRNLPFAFLVWMALSSGGYFCFGPKSNHSHPYFVVEALETDQHVTTETASPPSITPTCQDRLRSILPILGDDSEAFEASRPLPIVVHRNGEPTPCGEVGVRDFLEQFQKDYQTLGCPLDLEKYHFESLLTKSLHTVLSSSACHSLETYGDKTKGFLGYCDMGEDHTPILLDHKKLVHVSNNDSTSLPCHFHTREGLRITEADLLSQIILFKTQEEPMLCQGDNATQTCASAPSQQVDLYAVPAGRVFMFAPSYVGEIFELPHVAGASNDEPIFLEVLSLKPRVFDLFNFFDREESKTLVDKAIRETSESHRIKRSTTGASKNSVNPTRTSESGFDTHGTTAMLVKKRCFATLGFDEYEDSYSDGLQILRYNVSKAYNSHLDYIEDRSGQSEYNYDSAGTGGNRFATILLYMSDLGETDGGETVFPNGVPNIPAEERITQREAREQLRASEHGSVLKPGSWEENLVTLCRSQLSVRPHSSRAVLFYSQYPNGEVDKDSLHGACPVLNAQKYAANLWVWNTPRLGFPGAPIKKEFQTGDQVVKEENMKITATFSNSGQNPAMDTAELYYIDQFWGKLGKNDPPHSVNTFEGHVWNVKVDGKIVKTWTIAERNGKIQDLMI